MLREETGERLAYCSDGTPPGGPVAAGSVAAEVLARGTTVVRDETRRAVGTPLRFGRGLLGALVLDGVRADAAAIPLFETAALYLGARLHRDGPLEPTRRHARLPFVDDLTGVANRHRFDEALAAAWPQTSDAVPLSLVTLDLDYFRAYNDAYGVAGGDRCLQQVARALAECVQRESDLFARAGGEQFVVLLPATDLAGATAFAERLRATLTALRIAHAGSSLGRLSLSAGVASTSAGLGSGDELTAAAEAALYDAKIAGRNRVAASEYVSDAETAERVGAARSNLPLGLTRLIGRRSESTAVHRLLDEHRFVTIVGAGGTGKTRLALHVAAEQSEAFPDGAWFVDLAPLADPVLVAGRLGALFAINIPTGAEALEALARTFAEKALLLVIDNCEHLLEAVAPLTAVLLRSCPNLRILATSREAIGVVGEHRYRLPLLSDGDAVELFVERARAVRPRFARDDATGPTIAAIVRRLDGIALAIELAAARLETSTLESLAAQLDESFGVLVGGDRSALPRQQTMRATLDWSSDLLSIPERRLFRRLAVFAGTFTLDAAATVCGEGVEPSAILELLLGLVRKSLVVDDGSHSPNGGPGEHFALLDLTRAYGAEKLVDAGEADAIARRHAAYFADLAELAGRSYVGAPTHAWFAFAERNIGNYRAALEWSLAAGYDVVLGGRLAAALALALGDVSPGEAARWLRQALAALPPGAHPSIEAQLWHRLATSTRALPAEALRNAAEHAVALYRTLDEPIYLAHALRVLAQTLWLYFRRERKLADALAEEAIAVARAVDDELVLAYALKTRGLTIAGTDVAQKRAILEESLAIFLRQGNDQQIGSALTWLSEMEFGAGEEARALGYGRAALRYAEASGSRWRLEVAATNLAIYAASAGDLVNATRAGRKALRASAESRSLAGITWAIQALAAVAAGRDDAHRAARLLGFCDARCGTLHAPRQAEQCEEISYRRLRVRLAARLSPADLSYELSVGASLDETAAIAEALAVA